MPKRTLKRKPDADVQVVAGLLEELRKKHPKAHTQTYRYNSASIRLRVVDQVFKKMNLIEREKYFDQWLDQLPEEIGWQITMVLLLTPEEAKDPLNMVNHEFDDPTPSRL